MQQKVADLLRANNDMNNRLAVVVRDSNDAVTVQDLDGRILAWNPEAERMYGWSEAEALAMNIRELIPEAFLKKPWRVCGSLSTPMFWRRTAHSGSPKTAGPWR